MTKEELDALISNTESNVNESKIMCDQIVSKFTKDLDDIMVGINRDIIGVNDVPDMTLERYLLELSNAYFFISAQCESAGLYVDMAKSDAKMKYNEAWSDANVKKEDGKKPTINDLTIAAENASRNESIVEDIYSRAYKIITAKLMAANTMISTLSKILNSHDISRKMSIQ